MGNAKHIGGMWALAVALGVGMAVASSPAVASAKPADSDKGASHDSGPTSSDKPSEKTATSASSDPDSRHPHPRKPHGTANSSDGPDAGTTTGPSLSALSTADSPGTDARRNGRGTFHPASGNSSLKTSPKPAVVNAPAADPTVRDNNGLDFTSPVAATVSSFTSITPSVAATRASTAITPPPADPVSSIVVVLMNALLSPFANRGPTNTVGTMATDPDFITSTHDLFGLFSVTSAADPNDNNFVAFVLKTPFFTNVLTSGTDPEDNLGFGPASTGVAGQTVNTFMSPFLNFSIGVPVEDPFAGLFTQLVRAGF
ncbi:hypothetical protein [Mycolicibacterium moriokaense]|uniref:Uncharacterized protein n=1 Tax=Mycolicibacterium moriokaense TaxID=39691 RepID=A0A318HC47_9MYCO|nr:hypothetical protein [Mycolicibacterium moriokaense]PXX05606.1 hypothetical protein C8E89_117116 [Mycolicibacterium moriokaense]